MKSARQRKKDYERREESKIQREREAEGEQFKDKEAFVTSAYKKKIQEQEEERERELKQEMLEGERWIESLRRVSFNLVDILKGLLQNLKPLYTGYFGYGIHTVICS